MDMHGSHHDSRPGSDGQDKEAARKVLELFRVLGREREQEFDRITRLACSIFRVPMAAIGFLDGERFRFKARQGITGEDAAAADSLCLRCLQSADLCIVEDTLAVPGAAAPPLLAADQVLRFYAGVPLRGRQQRIGVLCLMDSVPRGFAAPEQQQLRELGNMVEDLLELRLARLELRDEMAGQRKMAALLRAIIDNEPECVKVVSADGALLDMNPAGLRMIEAPALETVTGQAVRALIHPDDRRQYVDLHRRALEGMAGKGEFRIIGLGGTERWMESHSVPLPSDDGRIDAVLSLSRDVSVARREGALRALEARVLDLISANAPLEHILNEITLAVDAMLPDFRSSVLLVEEQRLRHAAAPHLPAAFNAAIDGLAIAEGNGGCGTAAFRRQPVIATDISRDPLFAGFRALAREHRINTCWSTPVLDPTGAVLATFALYAEASRSPEPQHLDLLQRISQFVRIAIERKRQYETLRRSEERYRTLFDLVPVAIWEEDWSELLERLEPLRGQSAAAIEAQLAKGEELYALVQETVRVTAVNRAALQIFEADDFGQLLASLSLIFGTQDVPGDLTARVAAILEGRPQHQAELRLRTVKGREIHVLTSMSLPPPGTAPGRLTLSMVDITEQHLLQEQLRQAQRLDAIGQLTGGVAHDFNNLLTVILGNAETLAESLTDDQRLRMLADVTAKAAERAAELTSRLLAFARRQPLEPKATDINRQIAHMDSLLRRTLGEHVEIELVRGGGLWKAMVDPGQLENALLNLCINARDAMPQGGRLTLETANTFLDDEYARQHPDLVPGRYVMVAVSDTGTGMDKETLQKAFEPFFTTKEVGKGSGLGLSMVYGFIKQSFGHVRIYSEPGEGTTIRLYLPRADKDEAVVDATPGTEPDRGSERILLVEDDDMVREHVHALLQQLGYGVVPARNGREALELLEQQGPFDLLFTDVVMPGGISGRQLADMARARHPHMPVLYTSGYTENAIVHHGRLDSGVVLLQKPFRRQELAEKVRQVLGGGDDEPA